ncbi:GPGG-motif small membrane protein [Nocardiopsis coralliicola]
MSLLLLILGIVLLVAGVGALLRKQMLWGIVLIVVGVLVAPSGSIFGL